MTSTHAVAVIRRLFTAKRAGHAGTLDPLASGCLPIALGEATKTVPFIMDSTKTYRFTVRWGEERDTDDCEGRVVETSDARPTARPRSRRSCPRFRGVILQTPPRFSAIKIDGERAYDIARDGEVVELQPREVEIDRLELVDSPDPDHAVFRDRLRQRYLCKGAGARFRPPSGLPGPCFGAPADLGRALRGGRNDFSGTA